MSRASQPARVRASILASVSVAFVMTGPPADAVPPTAAPAPSTADAWHVASKLSLGYTRATSCPTSSVCWAITGGGLFSSPDGGASWVSRTAMVPAQVDVLDGLDCPTASVCYVAARTADLSPVVLALTGSVVRLTAVAAAAPLLTISCRSASHCMATDGTTVYVSDDAGTSWPARAQSLTGMGHPALSCVPATARCWVVGGGLQSPRIEVTYNDGNSWHPQSSPYEYAPLAGVDCPTTEVCYAVGVDSGAVGTAIATANGGATWTRQSLPDGTGPLSSVSCPSVTTCWAAGGPGGAAFGAPYVLGTTDAGAHWAAQSLGSFAVGSTAGALVVSCPTTSACAGVTGSGRTFFTRTGGTTWTAVAGPVVLGGVTRLSCPSRVRCVGMATDALLHKVALISMDAGLTWSRHDLPQGTGYVSSLDCPTVSVCFAAASASVPNTSRYVGQVLASTDGGTTWSLNRGADVKPLGFGRLSCPTPSACLAVGHTRSGPTALVTTDSGATWQQLATPPGTSDLSDVACPLTPSCVLLATPTGSRFATLAVTTADMGASYQAHNLPPAGYGYLDLDCFELTCMAVGSNENYHGVIAASTDDGSSWAHQLVPAGATRLQEVSCGSATSCAITGNNNNGTGNGGEIIGTTNAGERWTVFAIPPTAGSWPPAIACAGASCLASDAGISGTPRILAGRA
jgi:photosystem II stability/assembly factor-like uncharacterized protein